MQSLEKLEELREELSFRLIEADSYEYEELLEKLEEVEQKIEEYEEYGFFLGEDYEE